MDIKRSLIAWNPGGEVAIAEWPDHRGASDGFLFTGGAAYVAWQHAGAESLRVQLFTEFHTIVVRDRVDPQKAHQAFLAIDQYRRWVAPDVQGADAEPGDLGGF